MIGTCLYVLFTVFFCIHSLYTHHRGFFSVGLHKNDDTFILEQVQKKNYVLTMEDVCLCVSVCVCEWGTNLIFGAQYWAFFALFVRAIYFLDGLGLRVNREKSVKSLFFNIDKFMHRGTGLR